MATRNNGADLWLSQLNYDLGNSLAASWIPGEEGRTVKVESPSGLKPITIDVSLNNRASQTGTVVTVGGVNGRAMDYASEGVIFNPRVNVKYGPKETSVIGHTSTSVLALGIMRSHDETLKRPNTTWADEFSLKASTIHAENYDKEHGTRVNRNSPLEARDALRGRIRLDLDTSAFGDKARFHTGDALDAVRRTLMGEIQPSGNPTLQKPFFESILSSGAVPDKSGNYLAPTLGGLTVQRNADLSRSFWWTVNQGEKSGRDKPSVVRGGSSLAYPLEAKFGEGGYLHFQRVKPSFITAVNPNPQWAMPNVLGYGGERVPMARENILWGPTDLPGAAWTHYDPTRTRVDAWGRDNAAIKVPLPASVTPTALLSRTVKFNMTAGTDTSGQFGFGEGPVSIGSMTIGEQEIDLATRKGQSRLQPYGKPSMAIPDYWNPDTGQWARAGDEGRIMKTTELRKQLRGVYPGLRFQGGSGLTGAVISQAASVVTTSRERGGGYKMLEALTGAVNRVMVGDTEQYVNKFTGEAKAPALNENIIGAMTSQQQSALFEMWASGKRKGTKDYDAASAAAQFVAEQVAKGTAGKPVALNLNRAAEIYRTTLGNPQNAGEGFDSRELATRVISEQMLANIDNPDINAENLRRTGIGKVAPHWQDLGPWQSSEIALHKDDHLRAGMTEEQYNATYRIREVEKDKLRIMEQYVPSGIFTPSMVPVISDNETAKHSVGHITAQAMQAMDPEVARQFGLHSSQQSKLSTSQRSAQNMLSYLVHQQDVVAGKPIKHFAERQVTDEEAIRINNIPGEVQGSDFAKQVSGIVGLGPEDQETMLKIGGQYVPNPNNIAGEQYQDLEGNDIGGLGRSYRSTISDLAQSQIIVGGNNVTDASSSRLYSRIHDLREGLVEKTRATDVASAVRGRVQPAMWVGASNVLLSNKLQQSVARRVAGETGSSVSEVNRFMNNNQVMAFGFRDPSMNRGADAPGIGHTVTTKNLSQTIPSQYWKNIQQGMSGGDDFYEGTGLMRLQQGDMDSDTALRLLAIRNKVGGGLETYGTNLQYSNSVSAIRNIELAKYTSIGMANKFNAFYKSAREVAENVNPFIKNAQKAKTMSFGEYWGNAIKKMAPAGPIGKAFNAAGTLDLVGGNTYNLEASYQKGLDYPEQGDANLASAISSANFGKSEYNDNEYFGYSTPKPVGSKDEFLPTNRIWMKSSDAKLDIKGAGVQTFMMRAAREFSEPHGKDRDYLTDSNSLAMMFGVDKVDRAAINAKLAGKDPSEYGIAIQAHIMGRYKAAGAGGVAAENLRQAGTDIFSTLAGRATAKNLNSENAVARKLSLELSGGDTAKANELYGRWEAIGATDALFERKQRYGSEANFPGASTLRNAAQHMQGSSLKFISGLLGIPVQEETIGEDAASMESRLWAATGTEALAIRTNLGKIHEAENPSVVSLVGKSGIITDAAMLDEAYALNSARDDITRMITTPASPGLQKANARVNSALKSGGIVPPGGSPPAPPVSADDPEGRGNDSRFNKSIPMSKKQAMGYMNAFVQQSSGNLSQMSDAATRIATELGVTSWEDAPAALLKLESGNAADRAKARRIRTQNTTAFDAAKRQEKNRGLAWAGSASTRINREDAEIAPLFEKLSSSYRTDEYRMSSAMAEMGLGKLPTDAGSNLVLEQDAIALGLSTDVNVLSGILEEKRIVGPGATAESRKANLPGLVKQHGALMGQVARTVIGLKGEKQVFATPEMRNIADAVSSAVAGGIPRSAFKDGQEESTVLSTPDKRQKLIDLTNETALAEEKLLKARSKGIGSIRDEEDALRDVQARKQGFIKSIFEDNLRQTVKEGEQAYLSGSMPSKQARAWESAQSKLSAIEQTQMQEKEEGGWGGTARRLFGGFGLMYMRSIAGVITSGIGQGQQEAMGLSQTIAAQSAVTFGVRQQTYNPQMALLNKQALMGSNANPLLGAQTWAANYPVIGDVSGMAAAGVGAWGATQWAASTFPTGSAAAKFLGKAALPIGIAATVITGGSQISQKIQDQESLSYRLSKFGNLEQGIYAPLDTLAQVFSGGYEYKPFARESSFREGSEGALNKEREAWYEQARNQISGGSTFGQLQGIGGSGGLSGTLSGATRLLMERPGMDIYSQQAVASAASLYARNPNWQITDQLTKQLAGGADQGIPDQQLAQTMLLGAGRGTTFGWQRDSQGSLRADALTRQLSGMEISEEQRTAVTTGAQFAASMPGARYMVGSPSASVHRADPEEFGKLLLQFQDKLSQFVGTAAEGAIRASQEAFMANASIGRDVAPVNIADFSANMSPQEADRIMAKASASAYSVNQLRGMAQTQFNQSAFYGNAALGEKIYGQMTGMTGGMASFYNRLLNADPMALATVAQGGLNLGNLPGAQTLQGNTINANYLAMTDVNEGRLTGLSYGTTGLSLGSLTSQQVGANIYGATQNKYINAAVNGYKLTNPLDLGNGTMVESVGGLTGAQYAYEDTMYGFQQQGLALQQAQLTSSWAHTQTMWKIQDKQIALSNWYQTEQFGLQQEQINMSRGNITAGNAIQQKQMDFTRGWAKEDWGYQDTVRNLQWGWKQEDYAEESRFMTGRQRKLAERQMGRETTLHNLEGDQIDKQRARQEELWKLEDQRFDLQKKQQLESLNMQQKQLDLQKQYFEEQKKLQAQQVKEERKYQAEQHKFQVQQLALQMAQAKEQREYQLMVRETGLFIQMLGGQLNTLSDDGMNKLRDGLAGVLDQIEAIYQAGMNGPSVTGHAMGGSLATGASVVGERGWEYIIDGQVLSHEQSVSMTDTRGHSNDTSFIFNSRNNSGNNKPQVINVYIGEHKIESFILDTVTKELRT